MIRCTHGASVGYVLDQYGQRPSYSGKTGMIVSGGLGELALSRAVADSG